LARLTKSSSHLISKARTFPRCVAAAAAVGEAPFLVPRRAEVESGVRRNGRGPPTGAVGGPRSGGGGRTGAGQFASLVSRSGVIRRMVTRRFSREGPSVATFSWLSP